MPGCAVAGGKAWAPGALLALRTCGCCAAVQRRCSDRGGPPPAVPRSDAPTSAR